MALQGRIQPVPTDTQGERVYRELTHALLVGRFSPGEAIPIKALCEALGTGIMPVRESVQRLIGLGVLESYPNRTLRVHSFSRAEFDDLFEIRELLETHAAACAARRVTAREIAQIQEHRKELASAIAAGDVEAALAANYRFHFAVYQASGSLHLLPMIEALWLKIGPLLRVSFTSKGRMRDQFFGHAAEHDELMKAFGEKSARRAAAALRDIIRNSAEWYRSNYTFEDGVAAASETRPASPPRARPRRRARG